MSTFFTAHRLAGIISRMLIARREESAASHPSAAARIARIAPPALISRLKLRTLERGASAAVSATAPFEFTVPSSMQMPLNAPATLEREFLTIRAKILEIAAALDRLDRADGDVSNDPRLGQVRAGIEQLLSSEEGRAEAVQQVFSLPYEEGWRERFGVTRAK